MLKMRSRVLAVFVGSFFTIACASQHDASDVTGGREIGGIPPAPNVTIFRLKRPSPMPASRAPEFAAIRVQIKSDQGAGLVCAVKEYQDSLQGGGATTPHLRVVFSSFHAREKTLEKLVGKISNEIEVIDGGARACGR